MSKTSVAVAGKKDVVLLPVADLKMVYDVRRTLNDDRVLHFMELYDSGVEVPPIKVVRGTMAIHDGRHRKAALDHLNRKYAECMLVEPQEFADQLMDAFGENVSDSPFPPTRADITFVVRQLLEHGASHSEVQKYFTPFYRSSHVKRLLSDAHSALIKANMQRAVSAVAHGGASVEKAAKEHGVKPDTLRDELTGVKRRRRSTDVTEIRRDLSNRYRGNTQKTVYLLRGLFDRFEDGELSAEKVLGVVLHVKHLNADAAKRVDSWLERFEALKGTAKAKS